MVIGNYGHYARVLVDVDFTKTFPENLLVERVGKSFFIDVVYENLSLFYTICSNIGHTSHDCRKRAKDQIRSSIDEPKKKTNNGAKKIYLFKKIFI